MKERIKRIVPEPVKTVLRPVKRALRGTPAPPNPHPDWTVLLSRTDRARWQQARAAARTGPRVLVATNTGGLHLATHVESALAVALTLRGANVHVLLCDERLPACSECSMTPERAGPHFVLPPELARSGPPRGLCHACFRPADRMYRTLGLPIHRYGDLLTAEDRAAAEHLAATIPSGEIAEYCQNGVAVGEHALAGALRYFASGTLENEPDGEPVLRRYLAASLIAARVFGRLLDKERFDSLCFHHGIYVPQGLMGEVARQKKIPITNWCPAYRKRCFLFSHHDTYHHTLLTEPTESWENIAWTPALETSLMDYLKSRWQGTQDWIKFNDKPREELDAIAATLGVDFSKPCIGMLTNVMWDAQLHYRANAFPNMREWTLQTIRFFAEQRPDLQLIVRIHPAEVKGTIPSRQPVLDEIRRAFPEMPPNVFIIPPDSPISTYVVMLQCNAVLIYGTKTGVELTSMGIPVIVGGEAWIRGKGITRDAQTSEEYFDLLRELPLPGRLSDDVIRRARMYAFHFFFRRMIPLSFEEPAPGWPPYRLSLPSGLDDLMPGRNPGLDVVCDGILTGTPFIFPAERHQTPLEYGDSFNTMKHLAV